MRKFFQKIHVGTDHNVYLIFPALFRVGLIWPTALWWLYIKEVKYENTNISNHLIANNYYLIQKLW